MSQLSHLTVKENGQQNDTRCRTILSELKNIRSEIEALRIERIRADNALTAARNALRAKQKRYFDVLSDQPRPNSTDIQRQTKGKFGQAAKAAKDVLTAAAEIAAWRKRLSKAKEDVDDAEARLAPLERKIRELEQQVAAKHRLDAQYRQNWQATGCSQIIRDPLPGYPPR